VVRIKERRDEFMNYLAEKNITTIIHYPIPPHLSEAYNYLGFSEGAFPITESYAKEVISLPIYSGMTDEEQSYVIDCINSFK
jgi:dTDP-4-amino-4,6-dideoxygalactose transaminase